jgi:NhaA family Na+:H+ antiporter
MLLWINDALMAVFFLLVGLRLNVSWCRLACQPSARGVSGDCRARRDGCSGAALPGVYLAGSVARHGWAIPAATDIAFALGVLALLGSRVPWR